MLFAIAATLTIVGCSAVAEDVGSSSAATTITPQTGHYVYTATTIVNNNEPSCTWSPPNGTNRLGVWVCGFNDGSGVPVWELNGWSWSTDGITWTYCNGSLPACGPTIVPAGMVDTNGDSQLVADGEGNVAFIGMGTLSDGNTIVWAALSTNGGKSFPNAIQVNEPGPACSPAQNEDQPSADFDITTPSTAARKLSVVWRHNGSGTYGGCMRRGTFCANINSDPACAALPGGTVFPTVAWDTPSGLDIGGMDEEQTLCGQSGLIVQAGDGAVAVAAANCDCSMANCPDTSLHNCAWERVLTYDGGQHWTGNVHFDDTTQLQTCVVNGGSPPNGGRLEARHRGTFAFVRDRRNGDYYAATMHTKADIRLFRSQNQGASWTQVEEFTNPAQVPTIALPVLASDTAGRLALQYTESDSSDIQVHAVFWTNVSDPTPADPDPGPRASNWAFHYLSSFYDPSPDNGVRDIGDYDSIAVLDPIIQSTCTAESRFLPAWTDTLNPAATFMVDVAEMDVTP